MPSLECIIYFEFTVYARPVSFQIQHGGCVIRVYWKDPEIAPASYETFKEWRNIPDTVLSVDTSITQQLINAKMYRKEKLLENVDETNRQVCSNDQETVSHMWLLKKWHKHSTRTDTIECYDQYTIAYWKSMSLVNLKTLYLGISKVTQFHVWRMIKRKYCAKFHGIWKMPKKRCQQT